MSLTEVVNFPSDSEPSLDALEAFDAHAWAFVHFLAFTERGVHAPLLNAYVRAILSGGDSAASLAATIGEVARFDTAFSYYIDRSLFGYVQYETSARVTREGLTAREVPRGESAALRASFQVAMERPVESKALIVEAEKAGPQGVADEAAGGQLDCSDGRRQLIGSLRTHDCHNGWRSGRADGAMRIGTFVRG